ncbi:ATP-binding protein [Marinitenerispora sediminis]|uniref:LuxR family transcriptional regulator n=1 Tax=Marinitenerispora sediminis TaxID=1931232 RepID=A0A368T3G4_9ACTN|nr:LuxR C-terminal-related transcriptional regulator [Marinitenerispora sediminis]RCV52162.1 LuxR family transcriptional regulator [Marinitenerispora sediminis]RCV52827.1 LuxR family transcriptional regulator [Marinitenerispora sediminis]RCV57077.1 LuxR family transcriptional regulator [Marinitenerispora sediminis]
MSLPRQNLPARAGAFVGRERDVAEVRRLLGGTRLVTLTGTGGVGKTRLAVRIAADLPSLRLPDGVCAVDLAGADSPERVLTAVAAALPWADAARTAAADPAAVCDLLRDRGVLLLLDTCERTVAAVAGLCRRLLAECPGVRVLATSREPLRIPGETIWRVRPLPVPAPAAGGCLPAPEGAGPTAEEALRCDAVRLFVDRARAVRSGFTITDGNAGAVAEICRTLNGLPLAVELAAARVRVLSVEQILHRLDSPSRLLVARDRDLPERHRTLDAAVEWSYAALPADERLLLRRLSLFAGWPLDLAERVCAYDGLAEAEILDLHAALLDKSLIEFEREVDGLARYRLPDAVRHYAAERLRESGEDAALHDHFLRRCAAWFEADARRVAGPLPWTERLRLLRVADRAASTIDATLTWAARHGRTSDALRLCVAMGGYWSIRSRWAQGCAVLRRLLADADGLTGTPGALHARALALYAELAPDVDGTAPAERAARQALDLARAHPADQAEARALLALARVAVHTGDTANGRRHAAAAAELSRTGGERATEAAARYVLGLLARRQGDDAAARNAFHGARAVAEAHGDAWTAARCRTDLGLLDAGSGALESARAHLTAAAAVFTVTESGADRARCAVGLGRVAIAAGNSDDARHHLEAGLRLGAASGRRTAVACALEAVAELALAEERADRAAVLAGAAATLRAELGHDERHARRLRERATRLLGTARADAAWRRGRVLPLADAVEEALAFPPPGPSPDVLTPREREISGLVGAGLSNREIGARLGISQATAARHIANIFGKLDISARTQLAEWAARLESARRGTGRDRAIPPVHPGPARENAEDCGVPLAPRRGTH